MLIDGSPRGAIDLARTRLLAAGHDLDPYRVAGLVTDLARILGVPAVWERLCVPVLAGLPGATPADIAVEHAVSEGVRAGLDSVGYDGRQPLLPTGVLLAAAERETHTLALHALAAALRERERVPLHFGAALPWPALADAIRGVRPEVVVVWAQTTVTGSPLRLARLGRALSGVRLYAAGPGWPLPLPAPLLALRSLRAALAACLPG